jgi:hypothetical protein
MYGRGLTAPLNLPAYGRNGCRHGDKDIGLLFRVAYQRSRSISR